MRGSHEDRKTGVVQEVIGFDTLVAKSGLFKHGDRRRSQANMAGLFFILLILDQSESEQNDDWAERGVNF